MQDNCCGTGIQLAFILGFCVIITLTLPGTFRQATGGRHFHAHAKVVTQIFSAAIRTILPSPAARKEVTPPGAPTPLVPALSNSTSMGLIRHGRYENQCYESQKGTTSECTHFLQFC